MTHSFINCEMRALAQLEAEITRLRAEVEALRRGEFICQRCAIRKNDEHPPADFLTRRQSQFLLITSKIMTTPTTPLTDAEIAGFMNWRGPGAYTAAALRRVRRAIDEAVRREREACAVVADAVEGPYQIGGGIPCSCGETIATTIRSRCE